MCNFTVAWQGRLSARGRVGRLAAREGDRTLKRRPAWKRWAAAVRTFTRQRAPREFAAKRGALPRVSIAKVPRSQTHSRATGVLRDGWVPPVRGDDLGTRSSLPVGGTGERGRALRRGRRERGALDLAPRAPCSSVGARVRRLRRGADGHHTCGIAAPGRRRTRCVASRRSGRRPLFRVHGRRGRVSPGLAACHTGLTRGGQLQLREDR